MGIVGPVIIFGGMVALGPVLLSPMCHGYDCGSTPEQQQLALAGLALIGAGAVLTPIGWSMFARSLKGEVEQQAPRRDATPAWSFGFVPSQKNASFVAAYAF
jgi:hypothetical protein